MSMDKKQLMKRLYYMTTFDGGVYWSGKNARFVMNMLEENKDYLEYVKVTLEELTSVSITSVIQRGDRKPLLNLRSKTHPKLTSIRNRVYIGNHKVIDPHMLKMIDAEALAIIFMADGGSYLDLRFKSPHSRIALHTKGYSYADNLSLSKAIYQKLGIRTTVNRHNGYYYLNVATKDHIKFSSTVAPFMMRSFYYKLERIAPAFTEGW